MSDLISRDALLKRLNGSKECGIASKYSLFGNGHNTAFEEAILLANTAPAVDAAPIVHAHWELTKNEYHVPLYMCSNCKIHAWSKREFDDLDDLYKSYCMCCGAKIDEEVQNAQSD